jgi:GH35 family endo-1,4-beta-xylanase
MFTSRLSFIAALLALAVAPNVALETRASCGPATLKAAAGSRYFGAALAAQHLTNASDPTYAAIARKEFSGVTPENEMKWYMLLTVNCCPFSS